MWSIGTFLLAAEHSWKTPFEFRKFAIKFLYEIRRFSLATTK